MQSHALEVAKGANAPTTLVGAAAPVATNHNLLILTICLHKVLVEFLTLVLKDGASVLAHLLIFFFARELANRQVCIGRRNLLDLLRRHFNLFAALLLLLWVSRLGLLPELDLMENSLDHIVNHSLFRRPQKIFLVHFEMHLWIGMLLAHHIPVELVQVQQLAMFLFRSLNV